MADPTPQELAETQVNARYKVYDSQLGKWVEYFFRTKVSQIGISGSKKLLTEHVTVNGQPFVLGAVSTSNSDAVNEQASVTINASHISWYNGTKPSTNYLGSLSADNIQAALQALDTAAKAAYDHVPSGILLSSENQDLVAIEALAGTSGLLKKTGSNAWSLDTTAYTPQSRKINNLDLSQDRELTGENINVSSLVNQSLATAIAGLQSSAAGFTKGYGISTSNVSGYVNSDFNNSTDDKLEITVAINADAPKLKIIGTSASSTNQAYNQTYDLSFDSLRIGDTIYTSDPNLPDRWFAGRKTNNVGGTPSSYTYYFYKLESTNLTNYWNSSNAYISADGNGAKTITMGSNSFTASSSNPTASWGSAVTVGTVGGVDLKFTMPSAPSYTDTKNTAGSTDTPSKIYLIGATSQAANPQTYSQDTAWVDTDGCVYSNGKRVTNVVVAARASSSSDTPSGFSNAKAGDIWIDTTTYN